MGRLITRVGWVVVTAVLVSAFWLFYYNIGRGGGEDVLVAGETQLVDPRGGPPVTVAEGVVVEPAEPGRMTRSTSWRRSGRRSLRQRRAG